MATYEELYALIPNQRLNIQIRIAVGKAARDIWFESPTTPNHANRITWAQESLTMPRDIAQDFVAGFLIQQSWDSVANITSYSDSTVQNIVNGLLDIFIPKP